MQSTGIRNRNPKPEMMEKKDETNRPFCRKRSFLKIAEKQMGRR